MAEDGVVLIALFHGDQFVALIEEKRVVRWRIHDSMSRDVRERNAAWWPDSYTAEAVAQGLQSGHAVIKKGANLIRRCHINAQSSPLVGSERSDTSNSEVVLGDI